MSPNFIASLCLVSLLTIVGVAPANEPMKSAAPSVMACPKGVPDETHCYSGRDGNGAFYVIAKPNNWNGMLVVAAHGGPSPFGDENLKTVINFLERFSFIVREGYGWAASSFRRGGVAAKVAELYAINPDGSRNYDAALLTSGVLAGGTRSYLPRADMRAVYQYYCKNHP